MKLPLPSRVPIIYAILVVLIAVGVVPLYFYATKVVDTNRERLQRNEQMLQNTVTTNLAEAIAQHERDIRDKLSDLAYSILVTSGGDLRGARVESPAIRALLQNSIAGVETSVPYARLVNMDNKYVAVGALEPDAFLEKE